MPKANDKKRAELEQAIAKLKTQPREAKPTENYLDHVRKENAKKSKLPAVSSVPHLTPVETKSPHRTADRPGIRSLRNSLPVS